MKVLGLMGWCDSVLCGTPHHQTFTRTIKDLLRTKQGIPHPVGPNRQTHASPNQNRIFEPTHPPVVPVLTDVTGQTWGLWPIVTFRWSPIRLLRPYGCPREGLQDECQDGPQCWRRKALGQCLQVPRIKTTAALNLTMPILPVTHTYSSAQDPTPIRPDNTYS